MPTGQPPIREITAMNTNWKFSWAVIAALLVIGFTAYRGYRAFHESTPDWLRLQRRSSPTLPDEVRTPWLALRQQLDLDTKQTGRPTKSVQLVAIAKNGKQVVVYNLEKLTNPGFAPVREITVPHWTSDQAIFGYYLTDGTPLTFILRHHPAYPKVAFLAVETPAPLAPGTSVAVLRAEKRPLELRPDAAGFCSYSPPRVARDETTINAVAIALPAGAILKTYRPEAGAYLTTKGAPFVGWINSRLEARAPAPLVNFKLP